MEKVLMTHFWDGILYKVSMLTVFLVLPDDLCAIQKILIKSRVI
jgi:hypothetical protein